MSTTPWRKVLAPALITSSAALGVSYLATDDWKREPDLCQGVYADPEGSAVGLDPDVELGLCDQGQEVGDLQRDLKKLQYDISVTNVFDRSTRDAVINFQRAHERDQYELVVDGLAGSDTRRVLQIEIAQNAGS